MTETEHWNVREEHPEAFAAWQAAVAKGETTAGLLVWAATHHPDVVRQR